MTRVAIVGAGDIGGATAHALASRHEVEHVVLIDPNPDAAAGKALDIRQSGAIEGSHTRLEGTSDDSRAIGCGVCIIADRFAGSEQWSGDDALGKIARLAVDVGDAPLVFAGPLQLGLLCRTASESAVPSTRLIGSSADALASAIAAIVALEAGCSPRDIALAVLGVPPAGFVVPWNEASIAGYALPRVLSQAQIARLEERASRLWPPGPYALGAAAARIAAAILLSSRQSFSVLTRLEGEYGVRGRGGALPARLGPQGIVEARVPQLDARQHVRLQVALGA